MARNLFTTYYHEPHEERRAEIDTCLRKNLESGLFDTIYLIIDHPEVKPKIRSNKVTKVMVQRQVWRPTFSDFFRLVNSVTGAADLNLISNTDIYFGDTICLADAADLTNCCFALSRWDVQEDGSITHHNHADSADCWIVQGKIKDEVDGDIALGVPGCLSGHTQVLYNRGKRKGGRLISIEDFYYKFNSIPCGSRPWQNKETPTFLPSLNTETGIIFYNRVLSVNRSGIKAALRLCFADGTDLVLTPDHLIAIEGNTFVQADSLQIGDRVLARGSMRAITYKGRQPAKFRKDVYVKYYPFGFTTRIKHYSYKRARKARLVVEAKMNKLSYASFVRALNNDAEGSVLFRYLAPGQDVHHIDENPTNDDLDNLEIIDHVDHAREHGKYENFNVQYLSTKSITGIESAENIMTYDVTMLHPANNFCANDVVVHNCDNRIAQCFQDAGYEVCNPSLDVKIFHLHLTNHRTYNDADRIPGPYLLIQPTYLAIG